MGRVKRKCKNRRISGICLSLSSVLICAPLWFVSPVAPAQVAAPASAGREPRRSAGTKTGLDVLVEQRFAELRGRRVGLITYQTGVDREGRRSIDLLAHAEGVQLVALFSPEHGISGRAEERVASSTDAATGLPVFSLYGETLRPTDQMLRGVDAL